MLLNTKYRADPNSPMLFQVGPDSDADVANKETDEDLSEAWQHGWTNISDAKAAVNTTYIRPFSEEGYSLLTGRGLTVRNEEHVRLKLNEIRAKDWSRYSPPEVVFP